MTADSDADDPAAPGSGTDGGSADGEPEGQVAEAEAAIDAARQRLAEVPAEVVVTNHVMGLYELAAIHLSAVPPELGSAALAIDAVGCLVEGLGDRLGPDAGTMRDALANIRMAYVEIKGRTADAAG